MKNGSDGFVEGVKAKDFVIVFIGHLVRWTVHCFPFNPLYANFNIMHLAFNCEIKIAAHRRSLAYYVFVLLDPFPRANDEDVQCPV